MTPLSAAAPAKLNLYLHILGRRADGYHRLDSLFAFVPAVADRIGIEAAEADSLALSGPFGGALDGENLVMTAIRRLRERRPGLPPLAVTLEKNLPVAAGLGGGSADAAAVLRALAPDLPGLSALALSLGADVPACLALRPLLVEGIGETLTAAPALPPLAVVLANPRVPLSTAAVFKALAPPYPHDAPARPAGPWPDGEALIAFLRPLANDLEPAARRLCPQIGPLLALLSGLPGCRLARMAGSGPSVFGLFHEIAEAGAAAARLRAAGHWAAAGMLGS